MEHPNIESVYSTNNVDSWWSQCYVWQYFLSKITWQWQWKVFNVYRQRCLVEATRGPIHCLVNGQSFSCHHISHHFTSHNCWQTFSLTFLLQLQTTLREDFTITEMNPTGAFSWLKPPTSHYYVRHYALVGALSVIVKSSRTLVWRSSCHASNFKSSCWLL